MPVNPVYHKDISNLTVGGTHIEAVLDVQIAYSTRKLRSTNNGVTDGAVALTTIDRVATITIRSQDNAMNSLADDDVPVTIAYTAVVIDNTIYSGGASTVITATMCVPSGDNDKTNSQKDHGVYVRKFEMLSTGTLVYA